MWCATKTKRFLLIVLIVIAEAQLFAQKKFELSGYVNNMQSFTFEQVNKDWISDNLLHNRLNVNWNITNNLNLKVELRNRLFSGQSIMINPLLENIYNNDPGYLDLSFNLASGNSYILNGRIDRIYANYTLEKLNVTIGRQRINWGRSIVWNPNDLFNAYSFFDVDYPERPGSDAIRLEFYPSYTSVIDAVVKMNSKNKVTAALRYGFNAYNYDIQLLSGILNESDLSFGVGWEGNIKKLGFRGEMNYLHPIESFQDTSGMALITVSIDYTFENSLYVQVETLYQYKKEDDSSLNLTSFFNQELSIKNIAFSKWNAFGQLSYPFHPLVSVSFSSMFFPDLKGFFIGPSIRASLSDNAEMSLIYQYFNWEYNQQKSELSALYLKLSYNF